MMNIVQLLYIISIIIIFIPGILVEIWIVHTINNDILTGCQLILLQIYEYSYQLILERIFLNLLLYYYYNLLLYLFYS